MRRYQDCKRKSRLCALRLGSFMEGARLNRAGLSPCRRRLRLEPTRASKESGRRKRQARDRLMPAAGFPPSPARRIALSATTIGSQEPVVDGRKGRELALVAFPKRLFTKIKFT